ncbi:MAG: heme ABC exporter ATP-binding protein CcmA [Solirubrobacteraceae bacterium]
MTDVIEARGLGRAYGERVVMRDLTFTVAEGETLAVLGSNGAGKTTLLRMLATLLRPHAGTVRVLGAELPREGHKVRGRLGFLGHESLLHPALSPRENLLFNARLHGVATARIDTLLDHVGLALRADEPLRTFSRGMVQRVAICRAVLHEPELLLLDEPYANLDPDAVKLVAPLLATAPTRVLVSHDHAAARAEASQVLEL